MDKKQLIKTHEWENQEWYILLVDDVKSARVEVVHQYRWILVEGYWTIGKRIREDDNVKRYAQGNAEFLQGLAKDAGISTRTLYYALQAYDHYATLDLIPEGKNISWTKLITKYLPSPPEKKLKLTPEQVAKFSKQIILGDCLVELSKIPDKSIDMIYVDPPYNVGKDTWDTFEPEDFLQFTLNWTKECVRVLKPQSHLFIQFPSQKASWLEELILTNLGLTPASRIIWHYRNLVQGREAKTHFLSTYQPILHYNFGGKELNFPEEWNDERYDVWTIATPQTNFEEGKEHITQKPLELMERLVRFGSFEGETVLDPMAGSGTTGLAALKNNRDFVLIEREQKYVDIINGRLNE